MLLFSIIFFVSLLLMIGMIVARFIYTKLHQDNDHLFHKLLTYRVRKIDAQLKKRVKKTRKMMRYVNKKTLSALVHFIVEEIEEKFHKFTDFVRSKFPHHRL